MSPRKRRIFFLITAAFPLILVLITEGTLRLIGYGPDLSLFTTETMSERSYHVMNPAVKSRYFNQVEFNPSTSPDFFGVPKPPNTYRIFCLGGSTTVGYPYWYNGSFSTFLRDRLLHAFPQKQIEVINVGMTATNSFTVNDMARDLIDYEPDLFIVYDGHNEFYGALGIASRESIARARWLTNVYLRLIHFKTFLLLRDGIVGITNLFKSSSPEIAGGTMMEKLARGQYIPYASEVYIEGLETYEANVHDLVTICQSNHIPLLLGSQVSNLRDLPPFISQFAEGTSLAVKEEFNKRFNQGMTDWMEGRFTAALASFASAVASDSLRADAHFWEARCLDTLGRNRMALDEYIRARDLDQLRFRMSSDFNDAMRNACNDSTVIFVDIENAFMVDSPDSLIGRNLIFEHLHPRSNGYFIMAREYARAMRDHEFLASRAGWPSNDTITDGVLWDARPVTILDERIAQRRTDILTSGWPFREQFPIVPKIAQDDTLGHIVEMVTRAQWNWEQAHNSAAEYFLTRRDTSAAMREYATIINQLPVLGVEPYLKLAHLQLNSGAFDAMRKTLASSLNVEPTILAYRALGDLAMKTERPSEAVRYYEKALTFKQSSHEQLENGFLLAQAYAASDMKQQSVNQLLHVLNIKPDFQPAVELLARLNAPGK